MSTRVSLLVACAIMALVSVPLVLRKVPPNQLYGFRTRLTLSSPDIWYPANAFSGWALLASAAVTAVIVCLCSDAALGRPAVGMAIFLIPLGLAVAASFIYLRRFS